MFDIGKQLIALYLEKNDVISAFGAANSLVVLIGWAYYSAMILYFGAEFTKSTRNSTAWTRGGDQTSLLVITVLHIVDGHFRGMVYRIRYSS